MKPRLTIRQRPLLERIDAGGVNMNAGLYRDADGKWIDRRSLAPLFTRGLIRLGGEYGDVDRAVELTDLGREALS